MKLIKYIYLIILINLSCSGQNQTAFKNIDKAIQNKGRALTLEFRNESDYKVFPEKIYKLKFLKKLSFIGSDCDTRNNRKCYNIESIPNGLSSLSNLEELILVMNNIKFITDEINMLKKLKSLDLSDNTSLNIENLLNQNLERLNLNGCFLNKVPPNLKKMKKLKYLGLIGNNIDSLDIEILKKELPQCKISL